MAQSSDYQFMIYDETLKTLLKIKGHVLRLVIVTLEYTFNLPVVLEPIHGFYAVLAKIWPFGTLRKPNFKISCMNANIKISLH